MSESLKPPAGKKTYARRRWEGDVSKRTRNAEATVVTNTTNISTNTADIVTLDGRIDTLEGLVDSKQLASGTYTPTLYNTTNIAASSTYVAQYLRVGNMVTVCGKVDIDVTSTGNTVMGFSLPIASALTADREAGGVFYGDSTAQGGAIYADATNDRVTFRYQATSTSNTGFFYHFSYRIL